MTGRRERVLARATGPDGEVAGTRDALLLPGDDGPRRVPWEAVARAEWDSEDDLLHVVELAEWGRPSPEHRLRLERPDRLIQLVRERVTASIVLQRHVTVAGRLRARIVGRRAPNGTGEIAWLVDYDAGLDPADPDVRAVVGAAIEDAVADVHL